MNRSLDEKYYEENSEEYFASTVNIDPSSFFSPLLVNLNPGAAVLDIGCGSGRDLLWLKQHGYNPTGFEVTSKLAELARKHSGCNVIEGDFRNYDFSSLKFDCLISIGAFVHLDNNELPPVIDSLKRMLLPNGLFLITLKQGDGYSESKDGRVFTLWRDEKLRQIFQNVNLAVVDFSVQTSRLRSEDVWLGYLLRASDIL
jgi:SAM-dependent methyltransferase